MTIDEQTHAQIRLPDDAGLALLVGRAWLPACEGPAVIALRGGEVVDLSATAPTLSELLESHTAPDLRLAIARAPVLVSVDALLANSDESRRDPAQPWLLAPADLQPIKACGVTFVDSLLERLIEERTKGDPAQAADMRREIVDALGGDLASIVPGSLEAARVKQVLSARGQWSGYLEVGIGPDAEVFTKTAPLASVGAGAYVGLHPASEWNNPEPEVVLAVTSDGRIVGATLGNDVNLRDFEGRSPLLLGKAKDNNASCSLGPFVRVFDEHFGLDDVRAAEVALHIHGRDGFHLEGRSSMRRISRDPALLAQAVIGGHHQYPDGVMVFLGTMFAPTQDRGRPGSGFTHHEGDLVTIATPRLGTLVNRVGRSDRIAPWTFGLRALMKNLAVRGLLTDGR